MNFTIEELNTYHDYRTCPYYDDCPQLICRGLLYINRMKLTEKLNTYHDYENCPYCEECPQLICRVMYGVIDEDEYSELTHPEYFTKYYLELKNKGKIICECGAIIKHSNLSKHKLNKKHKKLMLSKQDIKDEQRESERDTLYNFLIAFVEAEKLQHFKKIL